MKYNDITLTEDIATSISFFKATKTIPAPNAQGLSGIDEYKAEFELTDKRPILNQTVRPDKKITNDEGELQRIELVNRIPIALQKRIVDTSVSFTFGNPVDLTTEADDAVSLSIMNAVKRIHSDNKMDSFNRRMARDLARCTEVAECWFPVNVENQETYGFPTPFKIKVQLFSPWNGDTLYPIFDTTGDMIAFCRSYIIKQNNKEVTFFEVYTDEEKIIWQNENSEGQGWQLADKPEPNVLKKIPVVYCQQENVEWHDVEMLINRLEKLLSNFGDTNDYFGSPILSIEGQVDSLPEREASGKAIQMGQGGKAEFLSWDQAPEAIRLEIETLTRFIYSLTQTPDISFDSVKGLQQLSGETLKMLFLDAHLKVMNKREIFDESLQRRVNIIKAFVGILNTGWNKQAAKLEITPSIVPFTITNEKDVIDRLIEANGGMPLLSQKTSVEKSGLVDNAQAEYEQIQKEETDKQQATQNSLFGATDN